jgi:hypothetical protein
MTSVPDDRRSRIVARIAAADPRSGETARLCEVCAEVTGMTGAGIMLFEGEVSRGSVCSTDPVSGLIERIQFDLGEGPCIDACRQGRPVLEPDLAHPVTTRWVAFSGPVLAAGARAVFGFPMQVGAVRLGALNLYRDRPGALTDDEHADALVMADIAAEAVLLLQADAPPGEVAAALQVGSDFRYVVHQASGMVSVQLGVTVGQALIRMRAYAFGNDQLLSDVARDVVARRLRFDELSGEEDPQP